MNGWALSAGRQRELRRFKPGHLYRWHNRMFECTGKNEIRGTVFVKMLSTGLTSEISKRLRQFQEISLLRGPIPCPERCVTDRQLHQVLAWESACSIDELQTRVDLSKVRIRGPGFEMIRLAPKNPRHGFVHGVDQ